MLTPAGLEVLVFVDPKDAKAAASSVIINRIDIKCNPC